MLFLMKTTLIIPDALYRTIKLRAAANGRTISDSVTDLLHAGLRATGERAKALPPLPSSDMGEAKVNIADRDALYSAMEEWPLRDVPGRH